MHKTPHKYIEDEESKVVGGTIRYGNSQCMICRKAAGRPIHRKIYRNKPLQYQLDMENNNVERARK